jgi:hypothetical protein
MKAINPIKSAMEFYTLPSTTAFAFLSLPYLPSSALLFLVFNENMI